MDGLVTQVTSPFCLAHRPSTSACWRRDFGGTRGKWWRGKRAGPPVPPQSAHGHRCHDLAMQNAHARSVVDGFAAAPLQPSSRPESP